MPFHTAGLQTGRRPTESNLFSYPSGGLPLARSNYKSVKRQKELSRKKKKEEKQKRKLERKTGDDQENTGSE
jgi:hypothetical protein